MIKKYRILIVEDDIALYTMYKMKFEKEGFDVAVATNGVDASVKIQNFKPDLILLDIMMPDMDGFETLRVIREQTSLKSKIIMFSNLNRQVDIQEAKNMGADDYIVKADVTPKEVVEKVKILLNLSYQGVSLDNEIHLSDNNGKVCPHCGKSLD